ncbi:hypothetical protein GCD22_00666 [Acidithiobacillus thiooxidans ATCC 19377]|uniref:Uncharacterized protein n=1 Tax=Acidithiobacillus thiooxidans ATCC 19377 TaxID=637390 RepID=A0A5P9XMD8_ACITH|nr:hypothetical protein GCD22_00666 [Acidithiobacillus thiooxidans ATCC 19377]
MTRPIETRIHSGFKGFAESAIEHGEIQIRTLRRDPVPERDGGAAARDGDGSRMKLNLRQ